MAESCSPTSSVNALCLACLHSRDNPTQCLSYTAPHSDLRCKREIIKETVTLWILHFVKDVRLILSDE